jgi:hypothetical protein
MPVPTSFGWQEAIAAFAVISIVAFLVTWIVTDLGHVSRTPYVGILSLTTLALAAGYLVWSGTSVTDLVTAGWGWGILGGVIAAALVMPLVRRLPSGPRPEDLVGRFFWEGIVYGTAEAILLATLPVLAIWQAAEALGWTDTAWPKAASGALAVLGALFVIAVHHLGYWEFRASASRKKLAGALVACGIQALAFLLTGNVLAPIVAHIVLHWQLTLRGNEMPPVSDTQPGSPGADRSLTTAALQKKQLVGQGWCGRVDVPKGGPPILGQMDPRAVPMMQPLAGREGITMRFLIWVAVALMLVGAAMLVTDVGAAGLWIAVIAVGIALVAINLRQSARH